MAVGVRGTVIVVDGCVEDHASLERILNAHGFAVSGARDGGEVLGPAETGGPEVVRHCP
jgi:hypothetical protein